MVFFKDFLTLCFAVAWGVVNGFQGVAKLF